mgnify:FL=1
MMDGISIDLPGDEDRPVLRLGRYLLERRYITEEQLKAALVVQRQTAKGGHVKQLGDILLEQGAIAPDLLHQAIREQKRSFFDLLSE